MSFNSKENNNTSSQTESQNINSWAEWFLLCDRLGENLSEYESKFAQFRSFLTGKTEEKVRETEFGSFYNTQFYHDMPFNCTPMIFKILIKGVIGLFLFFVAYFAYDIIKGVSSGSFNFDTFDFTGTFKIAVILGLFGLILFNFIFILIYKRKYDNYISWFVDKTKSILPLVVYIPKDRRSSQALYYYYDSYQDSDEVVTYMDVDEYLPGYLKEYYPEYFNFSMFYDAPFKRPDFMNEPARESYEEDVNAYDNEYLPPDIFQKTFKGIADGDAVLNNMVGMEKIKKQVRQFKSRTVFYSSTSDMSFSSNHMAFLGSAGTGKTTIARIITNILYECGLITQNKCVEVDGAYLKSPYVGQTSNRVNAIVEYSVGGVLFIDEAYTMIDGDDSSANEAVGVLLKAMEDYRDEFVVIFAGYESDINRLLSFNEGFNSRVKYKMYFDDFTVDELIEIFQRLLLTMPGVSTYKITNKALEMLRRHFEAEVLIPSFGNARFVRNSVEYILDIHADNYQSGVYDESKKFIITPKDVDEFIKFRREQMQEEKRNYIAKNNIDSSIISFNEIKSKVKAGSANPEKDLSKLIGLDSVKHEISQMKAEFEFYDGDMENEGNHMCFMGPPGTGKTTIVKIITGYLYKLGLITDNSYIDINGDFLRGSYLGQTGKRTEAVVQFAQGMVLFIDETYLLSTDSSGDQYGQEAIGVLLDAMEKYRKNFVVIFAGYDREMEVFFNANSGLRSRVKHIFHFDTYKPVELAKILAITAKSNEFSIEKPVYKHFQLYVKDFLDDEYFGNGRFVRTLFDELKRLHISKFVNGDYDDSKRYVITEDDFAEYVRLHNAKNKKG